MTKKKEDIEFVEEEVEIPTEAEEAVEEPAAEEAAEAPTQTYEEQMTVIARSKGEDIATDTHIYHQDGTVTEK